ncbi:glycosyltransferase family 2 protein [Histidinibacterium lentulum]|uniref:glycosyltransferase family 2 protein n=1 Tax=Histidinibacterium lentulum TaxID=2480588 RepID=UPI001610FAA8|nr:glycosyltransferase [Histidinibacterium lentulum]
MLGALYAVLQALRLGLAWRHRPGEGGGAPSVTVLQPILSGDPALAETLAVGPDQAHGARFVWLVDSDDAEGVAVATRLAKGRSAVRVVEGRPPRDGENPKTLKLVRGEAHATGEVVAVLDDDTVMPPGGLERLAAAAKTTGGLATALPTWGRAPRTASEALVAGFVDGQGASAYLAMARLGRTRTINGMAYAADARALRRAGGFAAMGHAVTDDWAIARLFESAGLPLLQTAVPARVAVTVAGPRQAVRLLRRWTIFAHRYVGANLDAAMALLVLLPAVLPLAGLILALVSGPLAAGLWLLLLAGRAALHRRLVRGIGGAGTAPLWAVVAAELALPLLSGLALWRPSRIRWRTRRMRLDPDGIRYE